MKPAILITASAIALAALTLSAEFAFADDHPAAAQTAKGHGGLQTAVQQPGCTQDSAAKPPKKKPGGGANNGSLSTYKTAPPGPCATDANGKTDSINYNASKSNTGNIAPAGPVKGSGKPEATANGKHISDGAAKGQATE